MLWRTLRRWGYELKVQSGENVLALDRGYATVVFAILVMIAWRLGFSFGDLVRVQGLAPTVATLSGGMFGFVVTGVSLVTGLVDDDRIKRISESRQLKHVFAAFFSASRWLALSTLLSVVVMFQPSNEAGDIWLEVASLAVVPLLWSFSLFVSLARLARVVWILKGISELLLPKERKLPKAPDKNKVIRPEDFDEEEDDDEA